MKRRLVMRAAVPGGAQLAPSMFIMQHEQPSNPKSLESPSPLSYATPQARGRRLGIAALCCGLVSPCVYLLIVVLHAMELHPGYRAAVTMGLLALASALAGICLSGLSLWLESRNGWAVAALALSGLALCFNCFALGNA